MQEINEKATIPASKPVKVHVNSHIIRSNAKTGENLPPLTIRRGRKVTYAHAVDLVGRVRLVYQPDKPLSCGAKVWIECDDALPGVAP